ncbi:MAG: hypothetical protein RL535_1123 [Pseudomonadota bacterium]
MPINAALNMGGHDMNTTHRTVIVTGAAGNLGRAVANAFAAQGANLVLLDLKREALEAVYGDENAQRMFVATNLLDQNQVNQAAAAALQRFGRIDVLCNLAGGFRMGEAVHDSTDGNWDFLFNINSRTLLHTARAIVPHMLAAGGGKIINVGAFAAQRGQAHMGMYAAAKSVVQRLTESMAAELRTKHINVNCVLPSIIDTPDNRAAMPDTDPANWVAPDALADVVVFLASDAARAIHGAALPVTGLS